MKEILKNWLKNRFLILKIRNRFNAAVQIEQRKLYLHYRELLSRKELPKLSETGFRVFSQFEEDGLLLYVFSILGMNHKTFIEIGSDDGLNSNSANLYFNFGWRGLFIDANSKSIKRGIKFYNKFPHPWLHKPKFENAMVTPSNINELIQKNGFNGEVGLLSIDIDGNDYWIWEAIEVIRPQVVIIESHNEYGLLNLVAPYDAHMTGKHPAYRGASPTAMTKLASRKGYRLIGANDLGFNMIYLRNDLAIQEFTEVTVESVLQHPFVMEAHKKFDEIKHLEYLKA